jgi:hypothetical protein
VGHVIAEKLAGSDDQVQSPRILTFGIGAPSL